MSKIKSIFAMLLVCLLCMFSLAACSVDIKIDTEGSNPLTRDSDNGNSGTGNSDNNTGGATNGTDNNGDSDIEGGNKDESDKDKDVDIGDIDDDVDETDSGTDETDNGEKNTSDGTDNGKDNYNPDETSGGENNNNPEEQQQSSITITAIQILDGYQNLYKIGETYAGDIKLEVTKSDDSKEIITISEAVLDFSQITDEGIYEIKIPYTDYENDIIVNICFLSNLGEPIVENLNSPLQINDKITLKYSYSDTDEVQYTKVILGVYKYELTLKTYNGYSFPSFISIPDSISDNYYIDSLFQVYFRQAYKLLFDTEYSGSNQDIDIWNAIKTYRDYLIEYWYSGITLPSGNFNATTMLKFKQATAERVINELDKKFDESIKSFSANQDSKIVVIEIENSGFIYAQLTNVNVFEIISMNLEANTLEIDGFILEKTDDSGFKFAYTCSVSQYGITKTFTIKYE